MKVAEMDRDMVVHQALMGSNSLTREIKRFFQAVDKDGTGLITWAEFRACLRDDRVHAHLQLLGLDINNARTVFALLDEDGHGEVTYEQFVTGFHRLRGHAKSIDLCRVLVELQHLQSLVCDALSASS